MFLRRTKLQKPLGDICKDFYENSILNPTLGDGRVDVLSIMAQTQKGILAEQDSRLANIDVQSLVKETINLRFELFGLAFLHLFGPDLAVKASLFTYDFLDANGRREIWHDMGVYNQQIARSFLFLKKRMGSAWERHVAITNKRRSELFAKYLDEARRSGIDVENDNFGNRIARPLNHMFTEKIWNDGTTASCLIIPFCDRLGFDPEFIPSVPARKALVSIITGLYSGARIAMQNVEPTDRYP